MTDGNTKDLLNRLEETINNKKRMLEVSNMTLDEAREYGFAITFGREQVEDSIKDAFFSGRSIGSIEGEIDALQEVITLITAIIQDEESEEE